MVHRWEDVGSFHAHNLDDDPGRHEYEAQKRQNFMRLVNDIRERQTKEEKKAAGKAKPRKKTKKSGDASTEPEPSAPPTTT